MLAVRRWLFGVVLRGGAGLGQRVGEITAQQLLGSIAVANANIPQALPAADNELEGAALDLALLNRTNGLDGLGYFESP